MRTYLLNLRERASLTQKEVSLKLGISESYYNLIERGERKKALDIDLLKKMCCIFKVSLDELSQKELTYIQSKD
ncbi:MAG: helix-turn-helix transcriptional regulator [Ruminococcus sp.]|nr:helix-turn-helix transcriptional regulator [Ruminococcus sp.]